MITDRRAAPGPLAFLLAAPAVEPHLHQAFASATLGSLRVAMMAKLSAMLLIALFLLVQFPSWRVSYWLAVVAIFAAGGVLQYRLARVRPRPWQKYAFMFFDIALLAFAVLVRNPLIDYGDAPPQVDLRFQSFLNFFIPLALATFTFTPRFVLFTGACIGVVWLAAVTPILLKPDTLTLLDMPNYVVRQIVAERSRAALARYFSPNMVEEIASLERPLGEVRTQHAAVLFADIVGFTAHSERLGAEATMALLRGFHGRMAETVFAHAGTVDKYVGDAIMATFGTPRTAPDDALRALRCARAMLSALEDWNRERLAAGEAPIAIGIGVHYGPVVAGDMGDARRLEYAVVGDTVNVASRIERLTRERGVSALVSADALEAARGAGGDAQLDRLGPAGTASVRGRAQPLALWALA